MSSYYDGEIEATMAHLTKLEKEHQAQEDRNAIRRMLCSLAEVAMEEDRTWFKWQMAVWHEQIT